ncbi:MAG: F0F1 ATP synthase subunit delta [Candidatus Paceibacterota bacterium]|jgi:F0F1-type ATP synthase delta subunit
MKKEKEISLIARAMYAAVMDNPSKAEEIFSNLKKTLIKKKEIIPAIIKKFINIYSREQKAKLTLAKEIDESQKNYIEKKIKAILGEDKEIEYSLNTELLAGFRLKTKDVLIKASLKDILTGLKNKIYGHN